MALRERGDNTPAEGGWAVPKPKGYEGPEPTSADEAMDMIREAGGEGAVDAVKLTMAAVMASDKFLETGEEEDGKLFFAIIDKLGKLPPADLRTVLASGVLAMADARRNYRKGNN
jgi:hypothetical protein